MSFSKFFKSTAMGIFAVVFSTCGSVDSTLVMEDKEQMCDAIDVIKNTFNVSYAPSLWKNERYGWDIRNEAQKAKDAINSVDSLTLRDFHRIVKNYVHSSHDYHVNVSFASTEAACFPIGIKGANGRYFITCINREYFPAKQFPFHVGDELLMFNNRPPQEEIDDIIRADSIGGNLETDTAFALMLFSMRVGTIGMNVPQGPITFVVKSSCSGEVASYQTEWVYLPEQIMSRGINHDFTYPFNLVAREGPRVKQALSKMLMLSPPAFILADKSSEECQWDDNEGMPELMGYRNSFLPRFGRISWESEPESPFHAYIFTTSSQKKVGYVRISHFMGSNEDFEELSKIIAQMEKQTSALVIDQLNNPGGNMLFLYSALSLFTDVPLSVPMDRQAISQEDVMEAVQLLPLLEGLNEVGAEFGIDDIFGGKLLFGYPVEGLINDLIHYYKAIITQWELGNNLTDMMYMLGIEKIMPCESAHYTKPIMVLTNSLDFSCADFFPAILQDNKRAITFGTRTAGAGGAVKGITFPNIYGISSYSYTFSMSTRTNGEPLEDLGTTPDIFYEISERDLQCNYCEYIKAVHNAIDKMAP